MTTTAPILPDRSGPDLSGVLDWATYALDPGGETYTVTLGPESERLYREAIEAAALPPAEGTPERQAHDAVRQGAEGALDTLRALRGRPVPAAVRQAAAGEGALTTAQLSDAVRALAQTQVQVVAAVQTVAGVLIKLVRFSLRRFDAED